MTDEMYENILGLLIEQNQILRELLEINSKPKLNGMYALWDVEQEAFLMEHYLTGKNLKEIIELIKEEFGVDRTVGALQARLKKLGIELPAKSSNNKNSKKDTFNG